MIAASVGVGTDKDATKAGSEAVAQALLGLPDSHAQVLIVFASIFYDQDKLIESIALAAPDTLIVGCSSAGEISSEGLSREKSVVVLALNSDQVRFWGGIGNHVLWNPKQAGEDCANTILYDSHGYASSSLLFFDVLSGNADLMLEGALEKLGASFPVFGGAAADDLLFFETFQYFKEKVYNGSIVGLGMSGDYQAAGVVMHGFLPIGVSRKVTKTEGVTIQELDNKPASEIYEEYFGEEHLSELHEGLLPSLAVSYPLGAFLPDTNEVILRTPVFVDQKGAMTFASSIPEGAEVRLMISDIERGLETAETAAKEVLARLNGRKPKAVIIVNSVARKKMLGLRADDEINIIQQILGRDVPIAGFYSYAQIGGRLSDHVPFHNGSILIWAIAE